MDLDQAGFVRELRSNRRSEYKCRLTGGKTSVSLMTGLRKPIN
jgi:hypothetical protein